MNEPRFPFPLPATREHARRWDAWEVLVASLGVLAFCLAWGAAELTCAPRGAPVPAGEEAAP